VLTALALTKYI